MFQRLFIAVLFFLVCAGVSKAEQGWVNEPRLPGGDTPPKAMGIKTIVIDPGHGGWDHGTVSASGVMEKDLVLSISKALAKKLSRAFKAKVILTRTRDIYVPLPKRRAIAEEAKADIFLSIHANSSPKSHIRGIEVYYLSEMPSDEEAGKTAEAENRAGTEDSGDLTDLTKTLLDLVQTGQMEGSRLFSEKIASGLEFVGKERMRGIIYCFWFSFRNLHSAIVIR